MFFAVLSICCSFCCLVRDHILLLWSCECWFVWCGRQRSEEPRRSCESIGRLFHAPRSSADHQFTGATQAAQDTRHGQLFFVICSCSSGRNIVWNGCFVNTVHCFEQCKASSSLPYCKVGKFTLVAMPVKCLHLSCCVAVWNFSSYSVPSLLLNGRWNCLHAVHWMCVCMCV